MDLYLEDLNRKRNEAAKRMQDIITTAESEKRELSAEETANLEKFDADFERYHAEEKRLSDMKDRIGPAADALREQVERQMPLAEIVASWREGEAAFEATRKPYLLY